MISGRKALLAGVLLVGVSATALVNGGCSVMRRSSSATPTPTKTPVLEAAEAPTPTNTVVTSSPTPQKSYDHCPLTGLEMANPSLGMRRPLDIKIDNYPGSRPASGIHKADVVFEHLAEGAITRFSAIFLCQDHERVGPVRSARLIDVEHLVDMFDGVLVHYGAANQVLPMIRAAGFPDMDGYFGAGGFFNAAGRVSPFNKYCDTQAVWADVEANGWQEPADRPGFPFSERIDSDVRVNRITVAYAPQNKARWDYDFDRGLYVRWEGDEAHVEESSGEQLTASNVVAIAATHTTTDIDEGYGSFSVRIDLLGEGPAVVFRDGLAVEGRWVRGSDTEMMRLLDGTGNSIPFRPGNIWIQVVPEMDMVETS